MTDEQMRQKYPVQAAELEKALQEANRRAREGDYALHASSGLVMETLVEPILTALGFGPDHRTHQPGRPHQCWIRAGGETVGLIICVPLEEIRRTEQSADIVRQKSGFGGPIIYTNGVQWRTHHRHGSGRVRDYTNSNPKDFEPLLQAGQLNRHGNR